MSLAALIGMTVLCGIIVAGGAAKGIIETITGHDRLSGPEQVWWERFMGAVPTDGGDSDSEKTVSPGA